MVSKPLVCYFVSRKSTDLPLSATPTEFLVAMMANESLPVYFFKQTWDQKSEQVFHRLAL